MASLQDQLLKAGMVDSKKAKQMEKEKKKQAKLARKGQAEIVDEAKQLAQKVQAEKAEKDRERNRQAQLAAEQKAIAAQIIQLIRTNRIERTQGDVGFQFVDGKNIKKIYVDAKLQKQLEHGQIAIVRLDGQYELVATAVAEKIRQRDETTVVWLNSRAEAKDAGNEEDDPYADFQIPDDLMW